MTTEENPNLDDAELPFDDSLMKMVLRILCGRNTTYVTYDLVGAIIINEGVISKAMFGRKGLLKKYRPHPCEADLGHLYDLAEQLAQRSSRREVFSVDKELAKLKKMQQDIIDRL